MDGTASENIMLLLHNTCNNYISKNEGSVVMNVPSFIQSALTFRVRVQYTLPSFIQSTTHYENMRVHWLYT